MTVRVAFRYGDRRWAARLICWWIGGDVAHCEVAEQRNGLVHWCVSSSFLDGGVRGKAIELPAEKWRVYEVDLAQPRDIDAWLATREGLPYDVLGLLGFIVRPIKGWTQSWFCSEVVADVLGFEESWRFDPMVLERAVARIGRRVQ